jgi:putative transposase
MVTASVYEKRRLFHGEERLAYLEDQLLTLACEFGWQLEAWAVFENHYHFVGHSPTGGANLAEFTKRLHGRTSFWVNNADGVRGRKVWFNYRQTKLTFEHSYLARLNYVHNNPVHHRLVPEARMYSYCSADWFYKKSDPAWYGVVSSFPYDRISVEDDFDYGPFV